MNRTVGLLAGLIGGSFGFIASLFVYLFRYDEINEVTGSIWLGFLFSLLAIAGSVIVRSKGTIGGIMLIIASVGVFITVPIFDLISAILIMIAGLTGITKAEQKQGSD